MTWIGNDFKLNQRLDSATRNIIWQFHTYEFYSCIRLVLQQRSMNSDSVNYPKIVYIEF